jgi:hypothetical protein
MYNTLLLFACKTYVGRQLAKHIVINIFELSQYNNAMGMEIRLWCLMLPRYRKCIYGKATVEICLNDASIRGPTTGVTDLH